MAFPIELGGIGLMASGILLTKALGSASFTKAGWMPIRR